MRRLWPSGFATIGGQAVMDDGKLVEISLAATSVTDDLLRNLSNLKHLRKLQLHSTEIGDPGAKHLAGLTSLIELDLSGTSISDAGLANLAGLADLRICGCRIRKSSVSASST